ncbi:MAG: hypothetical protein K9I74_14180 [Bacteroidales bacterium]|nr:hypothetical protein [Bacteroidales bacterium]
MELKVNLQLNQIIKLIKQLPKEQKESIKKEIDKELKAEPLNMEKKELTELLLDGPIMSEDEEKRLTEFNLYGEGGIHDGSQPATHSYR